MSEPQSMPPPVRIDWINKRWRPIGGAICVVALAYALIVHPLIEAALAVASVGFGFAVPTVPNVDKVLLLEMTALFVVYRSVEKVKGVATS